MTGYTRNDTADNIADGKVINASDLDGEFNAVQAAFDATTGHTHDGTTGGGAQIDYGDLANLPNLATAAITGGTIDGTTIGGTTAAAGSFTSLSASGNVTLSGGTANGVAYLNGSKVLTSGSALTFDGVTNKLGFQNAAASGYAYIQNAGAGTNVDLAFFQNATEAMRLTSTGLGIGTSSPTNALSVSGNANITGNTTLGNASTDTVTVNGYMGVGGVAHPQYGIRVKSSALTGAYQYIIGSEGSFNTNATTWGAGFSSYLSTEAAAFTITNVAGFRALDTIKGAGSTITKQHGLHINDQTQGTNNYGITSLVSSGTNKWNIYASGTAANYFAGNVGVGTSSPAAKLEIAQAADNTDGPKLRIANNGNTLSNGQLIGGIDFFNGDDSGEGVGAYIYSHTTDSIARSLGQDLRFATGGGTERLRIDSSGNLGLGVTPSAWSTNRKAMQIGGTVAALGLAAQYSEIAHNAISTLSGPQYATSNPAAIVDFNNATAGGFAWRIAPSGTAGGAISFSQVMTLDASGNLLVGGTSDAALDGVFGIVAGGSGKSGAGFAIESSTSQWLTYTNSGQAMIFYDARQNTERARIDSSGYLRMASGSLGIQFNGDTAAANALDDYEEGTWTPVVRGSTTNGTYTYSDGFAKYTKIGNQVTIAFSLTNITEVSAGTGYIQIAGLPFAKSGSAYFCGSVRYQSLTLGVLATSAVIEFIGSGITDVLYLRGIASGYGGIDVNISGITSGATDISATVTYTV